MAGKEKQEWGGAGKMVALMLITSVLISKVSRLNTESSSKWVVFVFFFKRLFIFEAERDRA